MEVHQDKCFLFHMTRCQGVLGLSPLERAEKEQQRGETPHRVAAGSSPLPTAYRQEEPIPACAMWQCEAGYGCVCRSHRHLCGLYPEVAGQQEQLPVVALLPLSDSVQSSWMKPCPAPAPASPKQ